MKKNGEKIRGLFGAVIDGSGASVLWLGFNLLLPLRRDTGVPCDGTTKSVKNCGIANADWGILREKGS